MVLLVSIATAMDVKAQEDYRFDIGASLGMTGYLGDANISNMWSMPSGCGGVLLRYIANDRWAFKSNLMAGGLRGDASKMTNVLPSADNYRFSTTFYELCESAEFNFFAYGIGETYRRLKRITPYITAGVGVTMWNTSGETGCAFTLPLGVGVKYKPSRRVNLTAEFAMKKTFTDRLDSSKLDDPLAIRSSFMKNTDWYSTLTFSVSYEFSKRCATCNYKD